MIEVISTETNRFYGKDKNNENLRYVMEMNYKLRSFIKIDIEKIGHQTFFVSILIVDKRSNKAERKA